MRMHFWHQNVQDNVVITDEGNLSHPWCPMCDILVPWRSLNRMQRRTEQCNRGVEIKLRSFVEEGDQEVTSRAFSAYGRLLEMGTSFRYLGQVIFVE